MKTLELNNLPAPVLLVCGLPEDAKGFNVIPVNKLYYKTSFMGLPNVGAFRNLPDGNWQLFGKLSEFTEEQAKRLVVKEGATNRWDKGKFRQYLPGVLIPCLTALESFHSAIEAEGYYVENPIPKPTPCGCMGPCGLVCRYEMWQDAQSKTLPANTLIFKKS